MLSHTAAQANADVVPFNNMPQKCATSEIAMIDAATLAGSKIENIAFLFELVRADMMALFGVDDGKGRNQKVDLQFMRNQFKLRVETLDYLIDSLKIVGEELTEEASKH